MKKRGTDQAPARRHPQVITEKYYNDEFTPDEEVVAHRLIKALRMMDAVERTRVVATFIGAIEMIGQKAQARNRPCLRLVKGGAK